MRWPPSIGARRLGTRRPGPAACLQLAQPANRQGGSMKLSIALLAVLGLLPMAQAQTTPHTPPTPAAIAQRQVQRYTTLLTLNANQVEQATAFSTTEATTEKNSRASERAAHQAME